MINIYKIKILCGKITSLLIVGGKQNEFMENKKKNRRRAHCSMWFFFKLWFCSPKCCMRLSLELLSATATFAIYCKHDDGNIQVKIFVINSECLHHDTAAVQVFQKHLVSCTE